MKERSTTVDIAILGAGFSGPGMAIRLRRQGVEDFLVLERHDEVGGTWWANTYPGCACDVPSHLYSFSFAPNPDWSQTYSPQPELRSYLQRCARDHDLCRSIRLGTTVEEAEWDDDAGRWTLQTSDGGPRRRPCRGQVAGDRARRARDRAPGNPGHRRRRGRDRGVLDRLPPRPGQARTGRRPAGDQRRARRTEGRDRQGPGLQLAALPRALPARLPRSRAA